VPCSVAGDTIELARPVHGVAPGQIACLLRGDVVVGCATIVG
jgi:tRNA-specific 2-thiouridylase